MSLWPERAKVPGDTEGCTMDDVTRRGYGKSRYLKVPEASTNAIIFPSERRRKALFLFWELVEGRENGSWQPSLPSEA